MAEYKIECEQFLGFSHSGSVYTSGEGTVELSDEEGRGFFGIVCRMAMP